MAEVAPPVKPEIKLDPGEQKPLMDIDAFEEDTDLQFPPENKVAWLARVPKDLWEAWYDLYKDAPDHEEIQVGTMRVYSEKGRDGKFPQPPSNQRAEILLDDSMPKTRDMPKKYDLKINTDSYKNTFVFSEKDQPSHNRNQPFNRFRSGSKPTGISKDSRYGDRQRKYGSAIPKQTALAPMVQHEAIATPIQDKDYYSQLQRSMAAQMAPKAQTIFQMGIDKKLMPGRNNNIMSTFTTTARPSVLKGRKKVPKEKAVRISQEAMFDALFDCFRQYRYWRLKDLRNKLHQPEAYIKSTLDQIATLIRSGDFAQTYVLKPEYAANNVKAEDGVKEEVAKVESGVESDFDTGNEIGDDEDDVEGFEDVKMEGA